MKKILLPIILLSIVLLGCSNSMKDIENSIQSTITEFFNEINNFEITDDSESLSNYFTGDSSIKEKLISYLTTFENERYDEEVDHEIDSITVSKFNNLYKAEVEYKVISKESNLILVNSGMNLYLKNINNQFKIDSGDFGG